MTRKHIIKMFIKGVFFIPLFLLIQVYLAASCPKNSLLQESIDFNFSSIESIILHPEKVCKNLDIFLREDRAYRVIKLWYRYQNKPFPINESKEGLVKLAAVPPEQRENHPVIKLAQELECKMQTFLNKALPHIRSFLPRPDIDIFTTIHFTIAPITSAFEVDNFPVVNIANPYWQGSASTILNAMVHELFHIFYNKNNFLKEESDLVNPGLDRISEKLQNEGMATYIAYKAICVFPASAEKDFKLLKNISFVRKLLKELNKLFIKAESTPYDKIRGKLWNVGVEQRGYYVVGAFMARTIAEKLGRTALAKTIIKGPRAFSNIYNNLVEEDMRIYEFKSKVDQSIYEKLRQAALKKDLKKCKILLSEIRKLKPGPVDRIPFKLYRVGHVLMIQDELNLAIELWNLFLELYPKSGDAFNALGVIYLKKGNKRLAIEQFKKALKAQSENLFAFEILRKL